MGERWLNSTSSRALKMSEAEMDLCCLESATSCALDLSFSFDMAQMSIRTLQLHMCQKTS